MGSIALSDRAQLQKSLEEARENYTKKHSASKRSHDEACQYMPGGNTRTVLHTLPFPFTVDSAHSCYIKTIDGHGYVDFLGEYTAGIYGHNHPVIRKAVEKALAGGWNYGAHSKIEQDLAKAVCTRFPSIELVRFVNSGTEANMMALATALVVGQGRKKVLVFEKGYHGSTISGRTPLGKPTINLPHDFVVGQYNDVQGTKDLISCLPENSLAAVLVEPMLGSGGCYVASQEFLRTLRELATKHRALLIFDEVMTSRLAYHGFHTVYGIKPDMMTLGKYIGGGMTFGAFGGRKDIMALYDPCEGSLEHPGTFNNNVFTMHAGVAGCGLLTQDRLTALNDLGDDLRLRVEGVLQKQQLLAKCTIPSAPITNEDMHQPGHPAKLAKIFVKGSGSLMMIHFTGPDRDILQGLFYHHMLQEGLYVAQRGFVALSIEITNIHVDNFVNAVDTFCSRWHSALSW